MTWHHIVYFASIAITAAIMACIARYSWRKRNTSRGAAIYALIALLVSLLSVFQGVSMIGPTEEWALFWFNLRIFCFATIPVLWLVFVIQYTGMDRVLTNLRIAALCVIPLVTQVMIWTNDHHGLWVKRDVLFSRAGAFFIPETSVRILGPWFAVHNLYTYGMTLAGLVLLLASAIRLRRGQRGQAVILGAGTLVMIAGALLATFNVVPGVKLNPLPQSFALGSMMIAWGMYRYKFLEAAPQFDRSKPIPVAIIALFMALTAGIIVAGFINYRQFLDQYREQTIRKLSSIAELKVEELHRWRKERVGDGSTLFNNITFNGLARGYFANPGDAALRLQIDSWLGKIQAAYKYDTIFLMDAGGVVYVTVKGRVVNRCGYLPGLLADARRAGRVIISDFHRDTPDTSIYLSVIVPLVDAPGGSPPFGFVVMFIDPGRFLYPMVTRWPAESRTAETLLVRRENDHVLYLNDLKFEKNAALRLKFPLSNKLLPAAAAVRGVKGIFDGIDYRGVPVVAALRAVPDSPWFLVARMDAEEVYEPVRGRFWSMLVVTAGLVTGVGAGLWIVWRRRDERYVREQIEAAEALRESEEKFSLAFRTSPYAITITRPDDGKFVDVNEAFNRITGYSREEVMSDSSIGLNLWANSGDRDRVVRDLMNGVPVIGREIQFRIKNGEIMIGLFSAEFMPLRNEQVILSSINDISDRKRAEEALRKNEQFIRVVLDNLPIGIAVNSIEPSVEFKYMNDRFPALYRTTREKLADPDNFWDAVYENAELREDIRRRVLEDCASGDPERMNWTDIPLARGGEETTYITARNIPLSGSGLMISVVWDVTERKRTLMTLAENEARLRTLVSTIPDLVWLKDPDGAYLLCNPPFERFFGAKESDILGRTDYDFVDRELADFFRQKDREALDAGRPTVNEEWVTFADDGRRALLETIKTPMRDRDGKLLGILGIARDITEWRRTEEALRASERRLKEAKEIAHLGYWFWDIKTGDVEWSEEIYNIFRLDPKKFKPQIDSVLALSPWPEDHERDRELIRKAIESRQEGSYEQRFLRPDNSIGYYYSSFQGQYDEGGALVSIVGTVMDITEIKRAEEKIKQLNDRLKLLSGAVLKLAAARSLEDVMAVVRKTAQGISGSDGVTFILREGDRCFYADEDAIGPLWKGRRFPLEACASGWVMMNKRTAVVEDVYNDPRVPADAYRNTFVKSMVIAPMRISDPLGAIGCYWAGAYTPQPDEVRLIEALAEAAGTALDNIDLYHGLEKRVSERTAQLEEANAAIVANALRVEDLYNHAPCGYHSIDSSGLFVEINDTELEWLGYRRDEVLGKMSFTDVITRESLHVFQDNFPTLKERGFVNDLEVDMVRKDGTVFPVIISATAIRDTAGTFVRSRSTVMDFREVKRAREELIRYARRLEEANSELESFSYSVSHDLRAPLRGIDGFSQAVIEDYGDKLDERGKDYLKRLRNASQRMGNLIDDILRLSRVSRAGLSASDVDLSGLALSVARALEERDPGRKAEFVIRPGLSARCDPALLRIVLENLIGNAWKFTSKRDSARIEFGVIEQGDGPAFFVRDNGAGFDMKYSDKLFAPFQRLHGDDEFEGTGIGLALVKRIITRHGGTIWAEGEEGKGATILFTLK